MSAATQDSQHRVSSADLVRNISYWQERAIEHPVVVTYHGRDRLVLGPVALMMQHVAAAKDQYDPMSLLRLYMSEAYMCWDRDRRCRDVNRAAEIYFSKTREEMLGRTFEELFGMPMPPQIAEPFEAVFAGADPISIEFDSFVQPGRRVVAHYFGQPDGAAALFMNVTTQVMLGQRLRRVEAAAHALEAHEDIASVGLNAYGCVIACSPTLLRWSDFQLDAIRDHMFADLLEPSSRRAFTEACIAAMEAREPHSADVIFRARDLSGVGLKLSISPKFENGAPAGVHIVGVRV